MSQLFFAAATREAANEGRSEGVARLGAMSAHFNAVNDALNAGSKPENLSLAPPAVFLEDPTPEGIEKATAEISRRLSASRKPARKPWWRFWG